MLTVHALEPVPGKGITAPSTRLDLVRLEAAVESAVCRALRQAMADQRKGATCIDNNDQQVEEPAEAPLYQAPGQRERPSIVSNVGDTRDFCQGALDRVLASVEDKAKADYEAILGAANLVEREMNILQQRIAVVQCRLAEADSKAQERAGADEALLHEIRARATDAMASYIAAGVISPEEAETHLAPALRDASERLSALRQEARLGWDSLQTELQELRASLADLHSRGSALGTRQTQLKALPCVAALDRARLEAAARTREAAQSAIHLLENAPWHELSWQKQFTPEMERAVALAADDQTVFESLVRRLGAELELVEAARPGLGWSVVRAIESLELPRLFPTFEVKRAELVKAARRYKHRDQDYQAVADRVVRLASRWGARVVGP